MVSAVGAPVAEIVAGVVARLVGGVGGGVAPLRVAPFFRSGSLRSSRRRRAEAEARDCRRRGSAARMAWMSPMRPLLVRLGAEAGPCRVGPVVGGGVDGDRPSVVVASSASLWACVGRLPAFRDDCVGRTSSGVDR